jgi:predicted adenine nucleotide alpha hydrolase (AANH) superfamily ATPase
MATTKEFTSFFGNPKPLTRREYQKRWVDVTAQMFTMFSDADMTREWLDMQRNIEKVAGIAWDNHE